MTPLMAHRVHKTCMEAKKISVRVPTSQFQQDEGDEIVGTCTKLDDALVARGTTEEQ
ncbi:hypothetical protein EWM64_g9809 [Hericium alpestre]|uniref:Uncharacterized protein n=1 Tax=Hericium alpestre TaxID=135208 RepID=A0A4Y9ZJY3_9AGAM|nr:hypothetical protein EWM64_g9809 [Hericium alpestre]